MATCGSHECAGGHTVLKVFESKNKRDTFWVVSVKTFYEI